LTAAAVSGLLLLMMPFLNVAGERVVFKLGGFEQPIPGACWFQSVTGLDCPFCGLSRGFVCAAHFRFAQAWAHNWVSVPALAFALFYTAAGLWVLLKRRRQKAGLWWAPRAVVYSRLALGIILLAGWLAKVISQTGT